LGKFTRFAGFKVVFTGLRVLCGNRAGLRKTCVFTFGYAIK